MHMMIKTRQLIIALEIMKINGDAYKMIIKKMKKEDYSSYIDTFIV